MQCEHGTIQTRLIDHCISPGRSRIRSRSVWTPCARRRGRRWSGAYREPGRAAPADPSSTAASRRTSAPDPRRTLHNNTHAEGLVRTEITILSITLIGCRCFNLNLCSEGERRSYGFGTTRGWVTNVFWVNCPFKVHSHQAKIWYRTARVHTTVITSAWSGPVRRVKSLGSGWLGDIIPYMIINDIETM